MTSYCRCEPLIHPKIAEISEQHNRKEWIFREEVLVIPREVVRFFKNVGNINFPV